MEVAANHIIHRQKTLARSFSHTSCLPSTPVLKNIEKYSCLYLPVNIINSYLTIQLHGTDIKYCHLSIFVIIHACTHICIFVSYTYLYMNVYDTNIYFNKLYLPFHKTIISIPFLTEMNSQHFPLKQKCYFLS